MLPAARPTMLPIARPFGVLVLIVIPAKLVVCVVCAAAPIAAPRPNPTRGAATTPAFVLVLGLIHAVPSSLSMVIEPPMLVTYPSGKMIDTDRITSPPGYRAVSAFPPSPARTFLR